MTTLHWTDTGMTIPAVDAVLAVAASHLAVREAGQNRGRFVEHIQDYAGGEGAGGQPWCAYWVYFCGHHALGAKWPLPRTGSVDVLLAYATAHGAIVPAPVRGCLFVTISPKNPTDGTHVGFVRDVPADVNGWRTLEGNSNDTGSSEGIGVFSITRGQKPTAAGVTDKRIYQFIDWTRLFTP